jgi:hypothetical protein
LSSSRAIWKSLSRRSRLDSFGGDQQRSRQSLGWIAGTNPLPLFFHEFSDRQLKLPHSRYTAELSQLAGESGRVTKDFWQITCFG